MQIAKDRITVDPFPFVVFNVVFAVTVLDFWLVGCIFLVVVVLVANVPVIVIHAVPPASALCASVALLFYVFPRG